MNKKSLYRFFISFLFLIAAIIIDRYTFRQMRKYTEQVDHTREVIISFGQLSNDFKSAQIYSPVYEDANERRFYTLYKQEAERVNGELVKLKKLVKDNPVQEKRIDTLAGLMPWQLSILLNKNIIDIIKEGESWRLRRLYDINEIISRGIEHEKQLLINGKRQLERSTYLTGLLTVLFSVVAGILILTTFISNVMLTRRHKWLEGFLESVLNTSQNGIITYKAVRQDGKIIDFKVEFANAAVEALLGIKPKDIIGKKLSQLTFFDREKGVMEKYIQVVETGTQTSFEEAHSQGKSIVWLTVILAKLGDGLTATLHNITDIKKYQDDLKHNINQLQHSNSELEQYAYIASHDLQEPLRKIRTFGSMLEQQNPDIDATGKAYIQKITSAAERMTHLIKDILSFSSLKKEQAFVPVDLNDTLEQVIQDLDLLIAQKEAIVELDDLPVLEAIPLQMHQLFYNLISNALKFTKEAAKPFIKVTAAMLQQTEVSRHKLLDERLQYCRIVVADNGIGFDQQFSEQIFGLFKRLNDKQTYTGSGIGLALCRKVVINHNGEITATSRLGEGTSFYIILPVKQPAVVPVA